MCSTTKIDIRMSLKARVVSKLIRRRALNHIAAYQACDLDPDRVYRESRDFLSYLYNCNLINFYEEEMLKDVCDQERLHMSYLKEVSSINKKG